MGCVRLSSFSRSRGVRKNGRLIGEHLRKTPISGSFLSSEFLFRSESSVDYVFVLHTSLLINNWFMRQRAYVEILSTREVWRARKRRKSL